MRKILYLGLFVSWPMALMAGAPANKEADYPQILYLYPDGNQVYFLTKYSAYTLGDVPRFKAVYDLNDGRMTLTHDDGYYATKTNLYFHKNSIDIMGHGDAPEKEFDPSKSVSFHNGTSISLKEIADRLPHLTLAEAKKLYRHYCFKLKAGDDQYDRMQDYISNGDIFNSISGPYVVEGDLFYAGLNGSQSEGSGGFGGLVVYDAKTKKVRIERIPELNCGTVWFMNSYKNKLVVVTLVEGEWGPGPGGIYACDPVKGICDELDKKGLFKDATIQHAILYKSKLFLSMDKCLGVIDLDDLKGRRWDWSIDLKEKTGP